MVCWVFSLESPRWCDFNEDTQHNFSYYNMKVYLKYSWIFVFLSYRNYSQGTQKRVRISHGKWVIGVRVIEGWQGADPGRVLITKTYLYNFYPLKPHFHIVKLGFTGVYIIFLFLLKNIDCGYSLEPPRRGGSNEFPQSMFSAEIRKILAFFIWKFSIFGVIFCYIFE